MEISKMINFCTIVECGNVSKAAEKLFCSQPALSKQISSIENELGYTLFIRNGKKLTLNENGEIFYSFAKNMINDYALLKRELFIKNNVTAHEVRFGTTNFIGTFIIPVILGSFKAKYPTTPVNFMVNFLPNIIDLLEKDVINFAIVPEDDVLLNNNNLVCDFFLEDEFVLALPVNHPLTKKEIINVEDIVKYPFLISHDQSATRNFILKSLEKKNIKLENLVNMHNTNTIKESIVNNLGISLLSKNSLTHHEKIGLLTLRQINNLPLSRKLYIVHKKNHMIVQEESLFMNEFLTFIP